MDLTGYCPVTRCNSETWIYAKCCTLFPEYFPSKIIQTQNDS